MTTNYFELNEFLYSDNALKNKIPNLPSFQIVENIKMMLPLLNGLREIWGSSIIVSSGYRCPELNKKVGGSSTSAHLMGFAVDLVPSNGKMNEFIECCKRYFNNTKYDFDQILFESSGSSKWVHVGYKNLKGEQRRQIFSITKE